MKTTYTEYKDKMNSFTQELRTSVEELELIYNEEFTVASGTEILVEDKKVFNPTHKREVYIDGKWYEFGYSSNGFNGNTEGSIMRTTSGSSNYNYFFIVGVNGNGWTDGFLKVYKLDKDTFPVKVAKKPFVKYG